MNVGSISGKTSPLRGRKRDSPSYTEINLCCLFFLKERLGWLCRQREQVTAANGRRRLSEQRLASAASCQESCGKTGVCGGQSAAAGTWQCDMKLTANPEVQILFCTDLKVSYMTGKILQMKDIYGGVRGRLPNTWCFGINNHCTEKTFLGYKETRIAPEFQLCCKLTLGFGQRLLQWYRSQFLPYHMEGTDTTARLSEAWATQRCESVWTIWKQIGQLLQTPPFPSFLPVITDH